MYQPISLITYLVKSKQTLSFGFLYILATAGTDQLIIIKFEACIQKLNSSAGKNALF